MASLFRDVLLIWLFLGVWTLRAEADVLPCTGKECAECQGGAAGNGPLARWRARGQQAGQPRQLGCWSHHNAFLCGSFRSEFRFIWGSCRSFFLEPCMKTPPPGYEIWEHPRPLVPGRITAPH